MYTNSNIIKIFLEPHISVSYLIPFKIWNKSEFLKCNLTPKFCFVDRITETDEEIQARRAKWEKFLLAEEEEKEAKEKENKEITKDTEVKDADKEIETEKKDSNVVQEDSDADTKSSVGSEYDTDEEVNN